MSRNSFRTHRLKILLPRLILFQLRRSIQCRPLRLVLKQPHSLNILFKPHQQSLPKKLPLPTPSCPLLSLLQRKEAYIIPISGKPMINARGQNNQIPFPQPNPNPIVPLTPNIEKPFTVKDIPNLFVLVQVLVEKHLYLLFVDGSHLFG